MVADVGRAGAAGAAAADRGGRPRPGPSGTAPGHGGYGWLTRSTADQGWWWPIAHPVRWMRDVVGDGPAFALHRPVRAQRGRRARPHRLRHPPARDPRRVRPRPPGRAHPGRRDHPRRAAAPGARSARMADRHSRVRIAIIGAITWGVFSLLTGLAAGIVMLAIVRSRHRHRPGDRRPHPQLAASPTTTRRPTGRGCTRSTGPPTRSAPSSGRSPPACSPTGSAGGCRSSSSPSPRSSSCSSPSG